MAQLVAMIERDGGGELLRRRGQVGLELKGYDFHRRRPCKRRQVRFKPSGAQAGSVEFPAAFLGEDATEGVDV